MTNRIAAATVIRGYGECRTYIDGVVSEEMKKINKANAREREALREQLKATETHRNRLLADRRDALIRPARKSALRRTVRRMIDKIQIVWALLWYINRECGHRLIALGLKYGLWEYDDE